MYFLFSSIEAVWKIGNTDITSLSMLFSSPKPRSLWSRTLQSNDLKQWFSYVARNKVPGSELSVSNVNKSWDELRVVVGKSVCDIGLLLALTFVDTGSLRKKNLSPNWSIAKCLRTLSKSPGTSSLATFLLKKWSQEDCS